MAISTYNTFLMVKGTGSDYSKVVDIKEFPDLGGEPETLETTTMTDAMQTFIMGLQGNEAMEFTANYTPADYASVAALSGLQKEYAVWFGSDTNINKTDAVAANGGDMGKFEFSGQLSVRVNGASVNEVVEMTISIIPNSTITYVAS
jgi:hypothetical protein